MNKTYVSTRNHQDQINFYQAIVQGIGDDGGLLVPNFDFQKLDLNKLVQLNYVDLATEVISTFVPEELFFPLTGVQSFNCSFGTVAP